MNGSNFLPDRVDLREQLHEPCEVQPADGDGRAPQDFATTEEVSKAIAALTDAELLKLRHFAIWRMRGVESACCGRTWEDLLSEARLATLKGASENRGRRWNKNIDLVTHLVGAMRSISSHWKRAYDAQEGHLGSHVTLIGKAISDHPSQERETIAREQRDLIAKACHDDPAAKYVVEGHAAGMKPFEIMQHYGLTKWEYQRAAKRIRLRLRKLMGGWE